MKICTHSGNFHADDVFAVAMLRLFFINKEVEIIRTRDTKIIEACDIVVDVGGIYDKINGRFDHHQKGGAGCRPNGVPYASAGLVWAEIGYDLCWDARSAKRVDSLIVQKIDAADCGYSGPGLDRTYSALISDFNPRWDESSDAASYDNAFSKAVEFAMTIMTNAIRHATAEEKARNVMLGLKPDNGILIMDSYVPWQEAVVETMPSVLFVVFPDLTGTWKVQTVPERIGSFSSRKSLPASWSGLQGKELCEVTGVDGSIFCHTSLFIAGNQSKEGAIAMARKAMES